ncbi:hypothetical protein HELRODRAFT_89107, partial [Helobdella robusta]|uniref:Ig-like domain-containing protein n=1 Tax=Helobdella robusta TaxID=6412 RepID=T1G788_HELRO
ITLRCIAHGIPYPKITWYLGATQILMSKKFKIMEQGRHLVIDSLLLTDANTYRCEAVNVVGKASREFVLSVMYLPVIEESDMKIIHGVVGLAIVIPCKVSGNPLPSVTWQKGSVVLDASESYKILSDGSLKILSVSQSDSGIYVCKATSATGSAFAQRKLELTIGPVIEESEKTFRVITGKDLVLPCKASGSIVPDIKWLKNGHPIKIGPSQRFNVLKSGWLVISHSKASDVGRYTCIAQNSEGTARIDIEVIINELPEITIEHSQVIVTKGDRARLECKVYGSPRPKLKWTRGGEEIGVNEGGKYRLEGESSILVIPEVKVRRPRGPFNSTILFWSFLMMLLSAACNA